MGRGGDKLAKLKSVLKKLNSLGHQNRRHAINSTPSFASSENGDSSSSSSSPSPSPSTDLRPVYVGQSRRRYLVGSAVACHPLFRELAARSGNGVPSPDSCSSSPGEEDTSLSIACEVVLFEHLLWMLENAESRPEPLDELVEFYAY